MKKNNGMGRVLHRISDLSKRTVFGNYFKNFYSKKTTAISFMLRQLNTKPPYSKKAISHTAMIKLTQVKLNFTKSWTTITSI